MKNSTLILTSFCAALVLTGCEKTSEPSEVADSQDAASKITETTPAVVEHKAPEMANDNRLATITEAQSEEMKARYSARHPNETLTFFGIEPGMTVVEALPGGGWYSKILLPYLGAKGQLVGADYAQDMYPKFGFFDEKFIEAKKTWVDTWTAEASAWRAEDSANISAFQFGSMPESMNSSADAVVFIRALHNLARFETDGGYLTKALADAHRVLKSGGIVGVVQHLAAEDASDKWASGPNGYLKKSFVITQMEKAGFEIVAENNVNLNPKDQPTEEDIVWRLPPTLITSKDNAELKAKYLEVGESSRMTLLFRKK